MSFKRFLNSHFVFGNKNHISFFQGSSFRFAVIIFRLHILILSCVLYKSQPSSQKDSPRTSD